MCRILVLKRLTICAAADHHAETASGPAEQANRPPNGPFTHIYAINRIPLHSVQIAHIWAAAYKSQKYFSFGESFYFGKALVLGNPKNSLRVGFPLLFVKQTGARPHIWVFCKECSAIGRFAHIWPIYGPMTAEPMKSPLLLRQATPDQEFRKPGTFRAPS